MFWIVIFSITKIKIFKVSDIKIFKISEIKNHNIEKSCRRAGANQLAWESITTGGVAGVITTLARPRHGTMTIELPHGRFRVDLARLGPRGRRWDLGGLGQQLTVCRLPPPNGPAPLLFPL